MLLAWAGAIRLARSLTATCVAFHQAKRTAIIALTLSLLMWLLAFLSVGAEWFLMWQSKTWNGQEAAFRMFTVIALILTFLTLPDTEQQP
jgi:predicted small integral membrane protein